MDESSERLHILEMIESGVITPAEGTRLLKALEGVYEPDASLAGDFETAPSSEQASSTASPPPATTAEEAVDAVHGTGLPKEEFNARLAGWRRWWMIPLWVGVGITIIGGSLMFWAFQSTGISFWFACAWLPFLLGLALIVLAYGSRTARWLHLRVHQKPGDWPQTIALSFPLPLHFTAWFLRTFRHYIPRLDRTGLDELILALEKTTSQENPFYVEVDEGEDGERVQIYIG